MAVFLGSPPSQPTRPRRGGRARRVSGGVLKRNRVVRQGFFRDHIAHKEDEKLIGDAQRRLAESFELHAPVLGRQIREIIRRLPRLVNGSEQREVFPYEFLQIFDEFPIDPLLYRHRDDPGKMALQPRKALLLSRLFLPVAVLTFSAEGAVGRAKMVSSGHILTAISGVRQHLVKICAEG
jgi:hypothetical protein